MQQHGAHHVVTIGDDVGLDLDALANRALDRIPAAVHFGPDRENHCP